MDANDIEREKLAKERATVARYYREMQSEDRGGDGGGLGIDEDEAESQAKNSKK